MTTERSAALTMSASHVIQVALKLLVARGGTCALTEIGQELRRLKVPYTGTLKNIFGAASPYVRSSRVSSRI